MDKHVSLEVLGLFNFFRKVDVKVFFGRCNYLYQFCTCLLQLDTIHDQSTISDIVSKEMIFLPNQCFGSVVKAMEILVITDYFFTWNKIMKNIKHSFGEKI